VPLTERSYRSHRGSRTALRTLRHIPRCTLGGKEPENVCAFQTLSIPPQNASHLNDWATTASIPFNVATAIWSVQYNQFYTTLRSKVSHQTSNRVTTSFLKNHIRALRITSQSSPHRARDEASIYASSGGLSRSLQLIVDENPGSTEISRVYQSAVQAAGVGEMQNAKYFN